MITKENYWKNNESKRCFCCSGAVYLDLDRAIQIEHTQPFDPPITAAVYKKSSIYMHEECWIRTAGEEFEFEK